MLGRRRRPDNRPIPDHPYRDTALVYGAMALVLVVVATLTGGSVLRAAVAALLFFALATAWSWWRFHARIQARDAANAAAAMGSGGAEADINGNRPGGTR